MTPDRDKQLRGPKRPVGLTRGLVAARLERGMTIAQIAVDLELAKSTVCYHARRLGLAANPQFARRYDWGEVQAYYDVGHSIRQCAARFGFCVESWHRAVREGLLMSRPAAAPIETYLVAGRRTARSHLKERLIAAGLKANRCERCGIDSWRGAPLSIALHHENGDNTDNRLANLSMLCPNCHSQTPNFSGRNRRRRGVEAALWRVGGRPLGTVIELPFVGDVAAS